MVSGQELYYNMEVDKSGTVPMYLQLYNYFRKLITSRAIQIGDMFPSELELCNYYNVSRTTIRRTFDSLQKEDLVVRTKGKGTFVNEPKLSRTMYNLYSFSDEMTSKGLDYRDEIKAFNVKEATEKQKQTLKKPLNEKCMLYEIVRLRFVNNIPLTLETAYIPVEICPMLSKALLQSTSLYKILHLCAGIIPMHASEIYSSVNLPRPIARQLECRTGTSAFLYDRVTYDINERPFEIAHIYVRGDRCCYEVDLQANNVSFLRRVDRSTDHPA